MHELLLFGQVPSAQHDELLQQLGGVTRMQPIRTVERHMIFRAVPPSGLEKLQQSGSQGVAFPPDVQRTRAMLSGPLYHVQLVRDITGEVEGMGKGDEHEGHDSGHQVTTPAKGNTVYKATNGTTSPTTSPSSKTPWTLEFRDIPEPGTHAVTTRLTSRTSIEETSALDFLFNLGFDYQSQYLISGHKFYDQDTTIFLHQILTVPNHLTPNLSTSTGLPPLSTLETLDPSGSFLLQLSIEASLDTPSSQPQPPPTTTNPATTNPAQRGPNTDSSNQSTALRARATSQLLSLKETLAGTGVELAPGERLGLDTRVNLRRAR